MGKEKKEKKAKKGKKAEKPETTPKANNSNSGDNPMTKYSGGVKLTKLVHTVKKMKNSKGKKIDCLILPIKANHFTVTDKGVIILNLNVIAKEFQDDYGQNGFISQTGNKKWGECSDEEKETFKALPILGNIKNFESQAASSNNDVSGALGDDFADDDDDDDLPF
jgi:hypothetical protein